MSETVKDTELALITLAAGQGSRMNSDRPKVLHALAGVPLIWHALRSGDAVSPARRIVVTGHGADAVEHAVALYDAAITCVRQAQQSGTADAVAQAQSPLAEFQGDAVVLYGDTPFISAQTLQRMQDARVSADLVVLGFEAEDPGRYGRLVENGQSLERIVEAKDASPQELSINLCNSGVVMADCATLFDLVSQVSNKNAAGEFYLTDIIQIGRHAGLSAQVVRCPQSETLGINTRGELAAAEARFQSTARLQALTDGVTLQDPDTTIFAFDTVIGRDSSVGAHTVFGPGVSVESGVEIRPFCHLEGCHISRGAIVGPFARLRPGAELQEDTHIGNFVEVKNSTIAPGAKVNHLSYVGDAEIGAASNIGAGTITCNYDGVSKHRTTIGARAFIGSNTLLVAPVSVGDDAMTGSGTVVTDDIPDGDLALARARQVNKPGMARRLLQLLRAQKAKKQGG
ncbi:MAG: bifunctional UDP-N-acetylglucosamine diphosphorylase/glucosamine-1-phosphate N-acetyltransferase GlmU [Pseudomonadota bacterium]